MWVPAASVGARVWHAAIFDAARNDLGNDEGSETLDPRAFVVVELTSHYSNQNRTSKRLLDIGHIARSALRPVGQTPPLRRIVRKLTVAERASVVARHDAGEAIKKIAREVGVAPQTVRRVLRS